MAVVRKGQSISNTVRKRVAKISVQAVRQPSIVSEMGDTDFGELGVAKDGQIVSYDSVSNRFILITADDLLGVSVEDENLPDEFITQVEDQIGILPFEGDFDGGGF